MNEDKELKTKILNDYQHYFYNLDQRAAAMLVIAEQIAKLTEVLTKLELVTKKGD